MLSTKHSRSKIERALEQGTSTGAHKLQVLLHINRVYAEYSAGTRQKGIVYSCSAWNALSHIDYGRHTHTPEYTREGGRGGGEIHDCSQKWWCAASVLVRFMIIDAQKLF